MDMRASLSPLRCMFSSPPVTEPAPPPAHAWKISSDIRWHSNRLRQVLVLATLVLFVVTPLRLSAQVAGGIGSLISGGGDARSYLPPIGGPGGGQFKALCGPGEYLTGAELRTGDDVDAIRPLCMSATQVSAPTPLFGGSGGGPRQLRCPSQTPAVLGLDVGAEGEATIIVNNIHLFCGLPLPNQRPPEYPSAVFDGPAAVAGRPTFPSLLGRAPILKSGDFQVCPAGQIATGINGRSGAWLDAVGLVCGAPPAPPPRVVASLGRVNTTVVGGAEAPICASARSARSRNSPAAPTLEAQCNAANAQINAQIAARNAQIAANEKIDLTPGPSGAPVSVCDAAQAALNRTAPEAADLVAKCRANGGGQSLISEADQLAGSGEAIANGDPLLAEFRNRQPDGPVRHGFDVGVAATGADQLWGPGKQRILDSLKPAEQEGFKVAASFVMDRNRNAQLAATGAAIAASDPAVSQARSSDPDVRFWLGFDIASALFGDPALGSEGSKSTGPGSARIQAGLSAPAQRGFIASTKFHLARSY